MRKSRPLKRILLQRRTYADWAIKRTYIYGTYSTHPGVLDPEREMFRVIEEELLVEARAMVARARKAQLARWLGSNDAYVRAFVFEHMGSV